MILDFLNHRSYVTSGVADNERFKYAYNIDFQNKQMKLSRKNIYQSTSRSQFSEVFFTDVSVSSSSIGILSIPPYDYWMIKTGGKLFVNLSDDNFTPSTTLKVSFSNGLNPSSHFLDYDTMLGFDSSSVAVRIHTYNPPNYSGVFYRPCYVTFHYDKTFDKSYVYFYINPLYVSAYRTTPHYIEYEVYKVPLSIRYTNCCLKQCFEPTKYIYYKG